MALSVKQIADLVHTSPETVRRWIRSGQLKANQDSRKDGNAVDENDLKTFLNSKGKYSSYAAGLGVTTTAVAAGAAAVTATVSTTAAPIMLSAAVVATLAQYPKMLSDLKNSKKKGQEYVNYLDEMRIHLADTCQQINQKRIELDALEMTRIELTYKIQEMEKELKTKEED